jgi:hypothetical protein
VFSRRIRGWRPISSCSDEEAYLGEADWLHVFFEHSEGRYVFKGETKLDLFTHLDLGKSCANHLALDFKLDLELRNQHRPARKFDLASGSASSPSGAIYSGKKVHIQD